MLQQQLRQFLSACKRKPLQEWKKFLQTSETFRTFQKKIPVFGYVMLVFPVGSFGLGTWQVKRRTRKLAMIEKLQETAIAPPVDLPHSIEELEALEFRRVRVRGHFDHSREMFINPRSLVENKDGKQGMISGIPKSGAWVVTPFILSDRDWTILVNRGWVPKKKIEQETRLAGQVSGEIELIGAVRLQEERMPFEVKNSCHGGRHERHWFRRDLQKMAEMAQSLPVCIDASKESTIPGGPIGGQTRVTLRNDHLSYLLTWYSISATTSYMWFLRYVKGILV